MEKAKLWKIMQNKCKKNQSTKQNRLNPNKMKIIVMSKKDIISIQEIASKNQEMWIKMNRNKNQKVSQSLSNSKEKV